MGDGGAGAGVSCPRWGLTLTLGRQARHPRLCGQEGEDLHGRGRAGDRGAPGLGQVSSPWLGQTFPKLLASRSSLTGPAAPTPSSFRRCQQTASPSGPSARAHSRALGLFPPHSPPTSCTLVPVTCHGCGGRLAPFPRSPRRAVWALRGLLAFQVVGPRPPRPPGPLCGPAAGPVCPAGAQSGRRGGCAQRACLPAGPLFRNCSLWTKAQFFLICRSSCHIRGLSPRWCELQTPHLLCCPDGILPVSLGRRLSVSTCLSSRGSWVPCCAWRVVLRTSRGCCWRSRGGL